MKKKEIVAMSVAEAKAFLSNRPRGWRIAWSGRVLHFYESISVHNGRGRTLCNKRLWPDDFYHHLLRWKRCALCVERHKLIVRQARQSPLPVERAARLAGTEEA